MKNLSPIITTTILFLNTLLFSQSIEKMSRVITNSVQQEVGPAISADGKNICYYTQGFDREWYLYYAKKSGKNWSKGKEVKSISTSSKLNLMGSHCLSPDGKTIFFSTKKYGGVGGYDLWYVNQLSNGTWSAPTNPGAPLNSSSNDVYPFFSADGAFIYYIRDDAEVTNDNGACGKIYRSERTNNDWKAGEEINVGNGCISKVTISADENTMYIAQKENDQHDIYVVKHKNNTWTAPQKLEGISTDKNEFLIFSSADARYIYFSDHKDETHDMYEYTIPKKHRAKDVLWQYGSASETKGKIEIYDSKGIEVTTHRWKDNEYEFILPEGDKYHFIVNPQGEELWNYDSFEMTDLSRMKRSKKNFSFQKPKKDSLYSIVLLNDSIPFDAEINVLAQYLKKYPTYKISISAICFQETTADGLNTDSSTTRTMVQIDWKTGLQSLEPLKSLSNATIIDNSKTKNEGEAINTSPFVNYINSSKKKYLILYQFE